MQECRAKSRVLFTFTSPSALGIRLLVKLPQYLSIFTIAACVILKCRCGHREGEKPGLLVHIGLSDTLPQPSWNLGQRIKALARTLVARAGVPSP